APDRRLRPLRVASRGPRHRRTHARSPPVLGRAPAGRAGPGRAGRPGGDRARRGDLEPRPADGGARRAGAGDGHGGEDDDHDRAPPLDRRTRRPGGRARPGTPGGGRLARRAAAAGIALRAAVGLLAGGRRGAARGRPRPRQAPDRAAARRTVMDERLADAIGRATGSSPVAWRSVEGGYTVARRGVAELEDGRSVFVKAAAEELTAGWLRVEH